MPNSYTNLLYHLVFSTRNREPLLQPEKQPRLYEYMGGTIRSLGDICLEIGGVEDYVHILVKLPPDKSISDVLRNLKANASGWMRKIFPDMASFKWQNGYGAFTVSQSMVVQTRNYIRNQEKRHKKGETFKAEFLSLLKKHEVDFREEYLWE